MPKPTKPTPAPTSSDYERGRAAGIFDALAAAAHQGDLQITTDSMRTLADTLGIPVLLVEAAFSHEYDDLGKLAEWWAARKAVA